MSAAKAEGVEEIPTTFLACRDKGHHWVFQTDKLVAGTRGRVREVSRWWLCQGCKTEQEEIIAIPSCEVRRRRYVYPDSYLLASNGEGRLSVRDVRRELFSRSGIKF